MREELGNYVIKGKTNQGKAAAKKSAQKNDSNIIYGYMERPNCISKVKTQDLIMILLSRVAFRNAHKESRIEGYTFCISTKKLALLFRLSVQQIQRHMKSLEADGKITPTGEMFNHTKVYKVSAAYDSKTCYLIPTEFILCPMFNSDFKVFVLKLQMHLDPTKTTEYRYTSLRNMRSLVSNHSILANYMEQLKSAGLVKTETHKLTQVVEHVIDLNDIYNIARDYIIERVNDATDDRSDIKRLSDIFSPTKQKFLSEDERTPLQKLRSQIK